MHRENSVFHVVPTLPKTKKTIIQGTHHVCTYTALRELSSSTKQLHQRRYRVQRQLLSISQKKTLPILWSSADRSASQSNDWNTPNLHASKDAGNRNFATFSSSSVSSSYSAVVQSTPTSVPVFRSVLIGIDGLAPPLHRAKVQGQRTARSKNQPFIVSPNAEFVRHVQPNVPRRISAGNAAVCSAIAAQTFLQFQFFWLQFTILPIRF